jgi:hypothetical protein
LDGGGIRGLYTACVLQGVLKRFRSGPNTKPDLGSCFDLIVGTSTGGILACALTAGVPIDEVIDLYKNDGPKIFTNPKKSQIILKLLWAISSWLNAANSNSILRQSLEKLFNQETVGELFARRQIGLCLTSIDLLTEQSRVFKTGHIASKKLDDPTKLVDICMATSAAPIYLPLVSVKSPLGSGYGVFADGGLWANNPIMIGLIEGLAMSEPDRCIQILSVGTRSEPGGSLVSENKLNRGIYAWEFGTKALGLSMNAQAAGANYSSKLLAQQLERLGKQVHIVRLPQTAPSVEHMKLLQMDLASKDAINALIALGEKDAIETFQWCQDNTNKDGQIINSIFEYMPELPYKELKEITNND